MKCVKQLWIVLISFFVMTGIGKSQSDPVLFSVEGRPVHVSEFDYIYTKTNSGSADYSRQSVEEYLDLYIKFKLKVQRARDMQLDTITTLARELDGYRRQLADTYLVDKEVTDKLIQEVYERKQKEREVAHILFKYKKGMDSTQVERIAKGVLDMLLTGADFTQMTMAQSEDPNVKNNQGNLGFLTAMMPNGFYEFENAVFETPVGAVYPHLVKTPMGLHIVRVLSERPASGELEVAHILIRDTESNPVADAKDRIMEAYKALNAGQSFDEVAQNLSEDRLTAAKGGYLGYFGINRYEKSFEEAAFALTENGTYSEPFKTSIGWHIVKRLNKKDLEALPVIKGRLQNMVTQDTRFEIEKKRMIERIKENNGFKDFPEVLQKYKAGLDMEFLTFRWKPEEAKGQLLFVLGDQFETYTTDFSEFLLRNQRRRLQMARDSNVLATAQILYQDFVAERVIKFEEAKLEVKYPEFKSLMREYEEGILLFEATKLMVWDKASQDTIGLKAFHKENERKYMWEERVKWVKYNLKDTDEKTASKILAHALKKGNDKTIKKYNKKKPLIQADVTFVERSNKETIKGLDWKEGAHTKISAGENNSFMFSFIEAVLPPQPKKLSEARGYIIADYQDYLEKKWVASLREDYKVEINRDVLESLIRI